MNIKINYLGVIVNGTLSWRNHIDNVAIKITKTVGMLSSPLRHYIPFSTLKKIYNALIQPYLSYGLISWGHAPKAHLDKLTTHYFQFLCFTSFPPLPFIATFSIYIILWLLHKFSIICKPEEGWYGQPKYCYKKQYTLF